LSPEAVGDWSKGLNTALRQIEIAAQWLLARFQTRVVLS
jgi:hypothetical protein